MLTTNTAMQTPGALGLFGTPPAPAVEVLSITVKQDYDADTTPDDYECYDAEEVASWQRDEWHFIGIWAEAQVVVNSVVQTIRSGGLWGIEDTSDREHLEEIAAEEATELARILVALGVDPDEAADRTAGPTL